MSLENTANVLGALVFALDEDLHRAMAEGGLDPAEAAALIVLSKYPGSSIEELRGPLAMTHSGCVRLVDRLVARGTLERRPGENRRELALHLTRRGRDEVEGQLARRARVLAASLLALTERERDRFGKLLHKVVHARLQLGGDAARACRACDYDACSECPAKP